MSFKVWGLEAAELSIERLILGLGDCEEEVDSSSKVDSGSKGEADLGSWTLPLL